MRKGAAATCSRHRAAVQRLTQAAPAAECRHGCLVLLLLLLLLGKHLLDGQLQLAPLRYTWV